MLLSTLVTLLALLASVGCLIGALFVWAIVDYRLPAAEVLLSLKQWRYWLTFHFNNFCKSRRFNIVSELINIDHLLIGELANLIIIFRILLRLIRLARILQECITLLLIVLWKHLATVITFCGYFGVCATNVWAGYWVHGKRELGDLHGVFGWFKRTWFHSFIW